MSVVRMFCLLSRDDHMDTIETMRDEFEQLQNELQRLRTDNLELTQNVRLTRLYRDEIDTLNERITKMDKYQHELERYRDRSHDVDTLKVRVEELQDESKLKKTTCYNRVEQNSFRSITLSITYAS
jgi:predicted nuclease with TOPRIM domain